MRSRYNSGFLSYDRELIEELHLRLFGKAVNRTCGNCYRDAYILIYTKLKKDKTMPNLPNYEVKAGVLIHPFGTSEYYTNPLPNDEVALDFLGENEDRINLFARYPSDWKEQLEKYKLAKAKGVKEEKPIEPQKPAVEEKPTDTQDAPVAEDAPSVEEKPAKAKKQTKKSNE